MKSCLYIEIYAFSCVSFEKLWADKLLRFQWQTEREFFLSFFGPGFGSISPWQSKRTKIYRRVITVIYTASRIRIIEQKQIFKHRNKLSDEVVSIICWCSWNPVIKIPINARHWTRLTVIGYVEESYEQCKINTSRKHSI